jgi:NAD(P)-dependent dehydrogenase (short-subunit alcohol dehydrogenase family)
MSLKGKVCIITGASGGIGKAVVEKLAGEGATLVLAARRLEVLEDLKAKVKGKENILCVQCDVTKQKDLESLINTTLLEYKKIDVVINGAGVSSQHPFWEQPLEDIEKVMYTNYFSYVMLARLVVNHMKDRKCGHIINITSGSVMVEPPPRNFLVYTSLKVGLRAFAKGLFWEMRDFGIKVTSIFPGVTDTPLTGKLKDVSGEAGRLMEPETIADAILFALKQPANACPLELAVINQTTPWTKPVIPFKQKHPEK